MHSLLPLIFLPLLNVVHASVGTVELSVSNDNQIQLQEIDVPKQTQSVLIQTKTLQEHYKISLSFSQEKQDLSTRNLVDANGNQTRLSQFDNGIRKTISPSLDISLSSHNLNFSFSQDVAPSLLTESTRSLSYQYLAYQGATIYNFSLSRISKDLPESYFTNPSNLQKDRRKTRIEGQSATAGIEQILTEDLKLKLEYKQINLKDFRPLRHIYNVATRFSISSRWTLLNSFGTAAESKSDSLSDDRGFLSANWIESGLSYEWKLDSFLGLMWGTSQEKELDPRRNLDTKIGNDTFAITIEQSFQEVSYSLALASSRSSEGDSATSGKGSVKWNF